MNRVISPSITKISQTRWFQWILSIFLTPLFLLVFGFGVFIVQADGQYESQIGRCIKAREEGTAKSIQDFVCPEGKTMTNFDVAYQVILDLEFKKIDKEVYKELKGYQDRPTKDPLIISHQLTDWFDETGPNSKNNFTTKYRSICSSLEAGNPLYEAIKASKAFPSGVTTDGKASVFIEGGAACQNLVTKKVAAYRDMGSLIGTKNIVAAYMNDKEDYTNTINDNYQNFLMQWTIYIGELSRIKSKWNIKTKIQNGE